MTDDTIHRGARIRALGGSAVLTAGLAVAGGVWAAPAWATCSPQARPCITSTYMKDPTTLTFTWTDSALAYQVRYRDTADPGFLGNYPYNIFSIQSRSWDIMNVEPGKTYALGVQACTYVGGLFGTDTTCTEWDEKTFTVPMPDDGPTRTLPKHPIGDGDGDDISPYVEKTINLPDVNAAASTATATADVDVYTVKNEPDGAGQVAGILRQGGKVSLLGDCAPESWCEVAGDAVPGGKGWVWGHLNLPQ